MRDSRPLHGRRGARLWCHYVAPHGPAILAALSLFSILFAVQQMGWLQPLELATFDYLLAEQEPAPPHPKILVVGIDEADIQTLRQWPIKDALLARALRSLLEQDAAMVGLDIYRDFPQEPGHAELLAILEDPRIIAVSKLGVDDSSNQIDATAGVPEARLGFIDFVLDPDGVVRRGLLFAKGRQHVETAFAMQLALHYLDQQGVVPSNPRDKPGFVLGESHFRPLEGHSGGYRDINASGFQILLSYHRHPLPAEMVGFTEVLEGRVDPEKIRGRIVLIGSTAESIKDLHLTPFSRLATTHVHTPGVLIHAHILAQMLDAAETKHEWQFMPQWLETLWSAVWCLVGALAAWGIRRPLWLQAAALVSLAALVGVHFYLFDQGVWIPLWSAVLGLLAGGLSVFGGRFAYQALHDPLTGLPNRVKLAQRLRTLRRRPSRRHVALILVELKRYNLISAVLGPQCGDTLLVETARRLRDIADEYGETGWGRWCGDLLPARTDGAQFALLMYRKTARDAVETIAKALHRRCSEPLMIAGEESFPTASIGVALGNESDQRNLLQDAHAALSHASALGKLVEIVDGKIEAAEIESFQTERELHSVVRKSNGELPHLPEFKVYYQPIVTLETGRISGFEALVRWQHPKRGLVLPFEFVPVAESSGMIVTIGNWVLLEACRQMQAWRAEFSDLLISVNLAAPQLIHPQTLNYLETVLNVTHLPPAALKLEITESATINHLETALNVLSVSRSLGVSVAIDDFGTGYSSLAYLSKFPVDILKIDMAFVRNMDASILDSSILRSIASLAQDLGLKIIAEGIETERHLRILRELQCDYGQGYLFGKPQTASEAEALLRSHPIW